MLPPPGRSAFAAMVERSSARSSSARLPQEHDTTATHRHGGSNLARDTASVVTKRSVAGSAMGSVEDEKKGDIRNPLPPPAHRADNPSRPTIAKRSASGSDLPQLYRSQPHSWSVAERSHSSSPRPVSRATRPATMALAMRRFRKASRRIDSKRPRPRRLKDGCFRLPRGLDRSAAVRSIGRGDGSLSTGAAARSSPRSNIR